MPPSSSPRRTLHLETTAYCGCGRCCDWTWGLSVGPGVPFLRGWFLPLGRRRSVVGAPRRARPCAARPGRAHRVLDRYWTATSLVGEPYLGLTSQETTPRQARRGPLHPSVWRDGGARGLLGLAARLVLPWTLPGRAGSAAADPLHLPPGTRLRVPGHGSVVIDDRGGDVRGPARVDLFYRSHRDALRWGRRGVECDVALPGERGAGRRAWDRLVDALW